VLAAGAFLLALASVVPAHADQPSRPRLSYGPIPTTISPEAQAGLKAAVPREGAAPGAYTAEYVQGIRTGQTEERQPYFDLLREQWTASVEDIEIAGVPVQVVTPKELLAEDRAGIYLHGGAYVFGSPFTKIPAVLASELGVRVYCVDYRLAPEHPFPAGLDDSVAVYRALLERFDAGHLVVFGDSAGGGLTLATVLKVRELGLPMPAAVALFSPWCDLTRTGDSFDTLAGWDPLLQYYETGLGEAARVYAAGRDLADPLLSPIYADYRKGFPPTVISTGTRDLFQSLCARLQRELARAGVEVRLNLWEGMWHVFEAFPIPEADESLGEVAGFLGTQLEGATR
jgi:acetyl esterase/lipase